MSELVTYTYKVSNKYIEVAVPSSKLNNFSVYFIVSDHFDFRHKGNWVQPTTISEIYKWSYDDDTCPSNMTSGDGKSANFSLVTITLTNWSGHMNLTLTVVMIIVYLRRHYPIIDLSYWIQLLHLLFLFFLSLIIWSDSHTWLLMTC